LRTSQNQPFGALGSSMQRRGSASKNPFGDEGGGRRSRRGSKVSTGSAVSVGSTSGKLNQAPQALPTPGTEDFAQTPSETSRTNDATPAGNPAPADLSDDSPLGRLLKAHRSRETCHCLPALRQHHKPTPRPSRTQSACMASSPLAVATVGSWTRRSRAPSDPLSHRSCP
jgi:hypothetical protein